jgi:uncharacterized alkaline shock family protein YloU
MDDGNLKMDKSIRPPGKTTIDPGVLLTIARLTTLAVEGVSQMGEVPANVRGLFRRNQEHGVQIRVEDLLVDVDVYVVLEEGVNILETSRTIQNDIARAISEMVGMEVGRIDVHIEDIDYELKDGGATG